MSTVIAWLVALLPLWFGVAVAVALLTGAVVKRAELEEARNCDPEALEPRLRAIVEVDRAPDDVITYEAAARWQPQHIIEAVERAVLADSPCPYGDRHYWRNTTTRIASMSGSKIRIDERCIKCGAVNPYRRSTCP